jgi:hypothetical protein
MAFSKSILYIVCFSQGADPEANSGNPIAIIAVVIGVLVVLGGKGFFF